MERGEKSLRFGGAEFRKVFKVFLWTVASALVVMIGDWFSLIEIPAQYAFLVPMVNTVIYALKEWIADNR